MAKSNSRSGGFPVDEVYSAEAVAMAFGGAVTFSPESAAAVAAAVQKLENLGDRDPDDAGRAVAAAFREATGGAAVSIDTALTAVNAMHARAGARGIAVGRGDQPGAARATSGEQGTDTGGGGGQGTAAGSGAASSGAADGAP